MATKRHLSTLHAGFYYFDNSTFGAETLFNAQSGELVGRVLMNTLLPGAVYVAPGGGGPDLPDARWRVVSTGAGGSF